MPATATGAAGASGGLAAGASFANAGVSAAGLILNQYNADKTRQFNREEAEKNREFQREMSQNNIKYAVQQANELGISPSLVLGDQTKQLGGSQASVNTPSSPNMSGVGQLANILNEQYKIKTMEEMQENKLEALKEMNEDKLHAMANSTTNKTSNFSNKNNYTKEQINSLVTDLNNFDINDV